MSYLLQAKALNLFPYEMPDVFVAEKSIKEYITSINSSGWCYICASCCGHLHRKQDGNPVSKKGFSCPQIIMTTHEDNLPEVLRLLKNLQSSLLVINCVQSGKMLFLDFPVEHPSWVYIDLVWYVNSYRDIQKSRLEMKRLAGWIKDTIPIPFRTYTTLTT